MEPAVLMPEGALSWTAVPVEAETMSPSAVIVSVVPAVTESVRATVMPESEALGETATTVSIVRSSVSVREIEPVLPARVETSFVASDSDQSVPAPSSPRPLARIGRPCETVDAALPETVTSRAVADPNWMPVTATVEETSRASSVVVIRPIE